MALREVLLRIRFLMRHPNFAASNNPTHFSIHCRGPQMHVHTLRTLQRREPSRHKSCVDLSHTIRFLQDFKYGCVQRFLRVVCSTFWTNSGVITSMLLLDLGWGSRGPPACLKKTMPLVHHVFSRTIAVVNQWHLRFIVVATKLPCLVRNFTARYFTSHFRLCCLVDDISRINCLIPIKPGIYTINFPQPSHSANIKTIPRIWCVTELP